MRTAIISAWLCVVTASTPAMAQRRGYFDDFIGWSPDHTFYVMTTAGTDGMAAPVLCLSKKDVAPPTWPKKVPLPTDDPDGCTERWDMMFPDDNTPADKLVDAAQKLVVAAKTATKGPKGETVDVHRASGEVIEVSVSRKGKRIARGYFELKYASLAPPDTTATYWRADGGAVAVVAAYTPSDQENPGYGPPSYLVVLPLDGSAANAPTPKSKRQQAQALNVDGMKSLTTKKLDQAQKQFQQATEADDTFMLAYYNLACAASLRKDKAASLAALRSLASSDDKDAKKYLAQGLTDHDLDFIAQDPEGAKLLKRKPAKP
jgi:hypothetical protein